MDLKYGHGSISFEPPPGLIGVAEPKITAVRPLGMLLKESFTNPLGLGALNRVLRTNKPGDVVIIVSDITRKITNYDEILRFLVAELVDAGIDEKNISFVVALGTHRPHIAQENSALYGKLCDDFAFLQHDCRGDVIVVGKTSTGLEVGINRRVAEADFVITTGRIGFHYLAGFSGGRKSILPGVASYETIRNNHKKLVRNGVFVSKIESNIIAREMDEAAGLLGVDYILNVVENPDRETEKIFCGHHAHAFSEAVDYFVTKRRIMISEPADCVIVSAGGYPNDKDFYHTHKAINLTMLGLKDNGSIILVGQCEEGFGNEEFLRLMRDNNIDGLLEYPEEKIEVGGHRAFLTAKILKQHRVYACTDLNGARLKEISFTPIHSIQQGIDAVKKEQHNGFKTLIVSNGQAVLPSLSGSKVTST
ncbi:MAG: nickel-dependent lactate racemase [candidate division WOR-3 bacterium]|nr:nickel-dependent lactate racemase [candidate division WOR-3 bacterium]